MVELAPSLEPLARQLAACDGPVGSLEFLGAHRLLPLARLLSERGQLPADIAALAEGVAQRRGRVGPSQLAQERRVLLGFVEAGVPALALKGTCLAHAVYPQPDRRWRRDLDILVDETAVDAARAVIRDLGYRPLWQVPGGTPIPQETWLLGPPERPWMIDLHWALRKHPVLRDRFGFDEQWAASVEMPGLAPGVRGHGLEHALLNAVMHWFDDVYSHDLPLVYLLDVDLIWRVLSDDRRREVLALAETRGLGGLLAAILRLARGVFATPVSAPALDQLTAGAQRRRPTRLLALDGRVYRAWWFAFINEPGWPAKWARVRHGLFPSPAHMRERFPEGSRLGLPGLYWRRIRRRM